MLPIKKTLDSEVTAGYHCTKLYKKRFLRPNRSAGSQIPNVMDNPCYKTRVHLILKTRGNEPGKKPELMAVIHLINYSIRTPARPFLNRLVKNFGHLQLFRVYVNCKTVGEGKSSNSLCKKM